MLILAKFVTKVQLIYRMSKEYTCVLRTFNKWRFKCRYTMYKTICMKKNNHK